ncbi:MAG: diaminopimelate decarboxylase, partial [Acidobacteriota bacterium]
MSESSEFHYCDDRLFCEGVPLDKIAERYGTPVYVYSAASIRGQYRSLVETFRKVDPIVFFAVKANSNLAILNILSEEGSSFDIVSGGELFRLIHLGVEGNRIIFSGVGKTRSELTAALDHGAFCLVMESLSEIELLAELMQTRSDRVKISLRINPE